MKKVKALWHEVGLCCPKCNGTPTILSMDANCIGGVRLNLVCVTCGVQLAFETTLEHLVCSALILDFDEAKLSLGSQSQIPDDADKKFLKDSGIDPDITATGGEK